MNMTIKSLVGVVALAVAAQAAAQVTFYESEEFGGRSFTTDRQIGNLERLGFNDRASSVIVTGGRWELCEDERFSGRCIVLRPGRYESLAELGLNNRVSSVRAVIRNAANIPPPAYANAPPVYLEQAPVYAANDRYARRDNERLYQVDITSARAVFGPPEQRCWVDREQVQGNYGNANVPGAILGAVIGGVIGHQIGGGRGRDVATGVGAVSGAALGANVGRDGNVYSQDVQRCTTVSNSQPSYWDVTYDFRGIEHRMQTNTAPGATIVVNSDGEPRAQ